MATNFRRAMGATERMRLWFPNINVVMVCQIAGQVSEPDLRAAIAKARRKHPLLGARVELDDDGVGWFTTQAVPEIPLDVISGATDNDWLRQMKVELAHRWPVRSGPLARFVLIQSANGSDLIVNAHHSICDARSLAYLFRDIVHFMHEPVAMPDIEPAIPVALEAAIPTSASGSFISRLVMKRMNKKWLRKDITFTERDYRALHSTFWDKHEATIYSWSLTVAETASLVSQCRQRGISVNSALYTAFLAAQYRVQRNDADGFDNVLVPVDFRDYLVEQTGEALGLYASALQLQFAYEGHRPFWAVAQAFDTRVKRQLTNENIFASQRINALHPSLLDGLAFAMFGDFDDEMARGLAERVQRKMHTGILVSNLGKLDLPTAYGNLRLEAMIPPAIYAGNAEKALEVLTIGGRMYFTLTFDTAVVADEVVRAVKAEAMKILTGSDRG